MIDEAARSNDLVLREELLRDAKDKLEGFVKAHAQRPEARDALVQLAKLLVERGYLAMLLGEETQDKAKKEAKVAEARAAFIQAHEAYGKAVEALGRGQGKYPDLHARERPPPRGARRRLRLVPRRHAPEGRLRLRAGPDLSGRRPPNGRKYLDEALEQFEGCTRTTASSGPGWPRRCGRPSASRRRARSGRRSGCTSSSWSTPILACARSSATSATFTSWPWRKRKEYALAADQATHWLRGFNRREERRTQGGPGGAARDVQGHRRPDAGDLRGRSPQGRQADRRRRRARSFATPRRSRMRPSPCSRNTSPAPRSRPRRSPASPTRTPWRRPTKRSPRTSGTARSSCSRRPCARPIPSARSRRSTWPGTTWPSAIT